MRTLDVASAGGSYRVVITAGGLADPAGLLAGLDQVPPRDIVSDTVVGPLHGRHLAAALGAAPPLELAPGETHKHWPQVEAVCRRWLELGVGRSDTVLAVGGGVLTDTVGFAAAVFMRGLAWIAVPTTLLAMVDATVGGKTGVNLPEGKNLVGAFWPPRLVVADPGVLATLPPRELRAGLAEVVKAGWLGDRGLLELAASVPAGYQPADAGRWSELVARAVAVKIGVVTADEREAGTRKSLNLGHTLGHALEAASGYRRFLHGEAVAWGLRAVGLMSVRRGLLSAAGWSQLAAAVDRLEPLPGLDGLEPEAVLACLGRDKKRDDLGVAWVLPTDDGVRLDQRVPAAEIRSVLAELTR